MKTIVVLPGGFHPYHAGHYALYKSAKEAFPGADVYVAATNSQEQRPFPFAIKEKLAKVAGVEPGHFIQVKSPFQAKEITQHYDPNQDVLIFVRSEKDRNESPKPGGMKKDGSPAYFQPYTGKNLQPFSKHAYFAYLPTVEFGPGITSATEIRNAWPTLNNSRKTAMVMSLYPATQKNPKLAANVVKLLDAGMGGAEGLTEDTSSSSLPDVLYHGGEHLISKFKIPPFGVFFSPHKEHAEVYGDAITRAKVNASPVYLVDYDEDIDEDIIDALFDRDYRKLAKYVRLLQSKGYKALQTVTDSEMVCVFPGGDIQVLPPEQDVDEGAEEALQFATQAHAGQTRAGGDPYITHPMSVADSIKQYKKSHNLDAIISAALLHDTIEDTDTTHEALQDLFGGLVASLVQELTSDKEKIKQMGKADYLAQKMAAMSSYALVIKLADRLDNVKDIATAKTPEWRERYKAETEKILNYIEKHRALSGTHRKFIELIRNKLGEINDPQEQGVAEGEEDINHLQKELWDLHKEATGYRPRPGVVDWTQEQWNNPEFLKHMITKLTQQLFPQGDSVAEGQGDQISKTKALSTLRKELMNSYEYMKSGNLTEFKQRLLWLSEGMLKNHITHVVNYVINMEEIELYQEYREKREQIQRGLTKGVAEADDKKEWKKQNAKPKQLGKTEKYFSTRHTTKDTGAADKEQGVAEGSGGNWYIRVNGKILNDTKYKPEIFSSEDEARSHAMKLADKKRIPLSQIKLTKSWMDAPEQGVAEDSEQSIPSILYHATYKPRLKNIKLKGLGAGGKRNWEESKRGVVYLALDPNVAESYAETSDMVPDEWLDQIVILKIATAGLDPNKFYIDSNVQDNQGDTLEYHGVIPLKNISLYKQGVAEAKETDPVTSAVLNFYKPVVYDIHKEKVDNYVELARSMVQKTNDPNIRKKLIDIFKTGKENPYIQGGIVTTVGALLAGGVLSTSQRLGLSPAQTNLVLQAILNTVIPTVVSRINGKNWADTIKYTLASAGVGTGIAGASLIEGDLEENMVIGCCPNDVVNENLGLQQSGTYAETHKMKKPFGHRTIAMTDVSKNNDYLEEK